MPKYHYYEGLINVSVDESLLDENLGALHVRIDEAVGDLSGVVERLDRLDERLDEYEDTPTVETLSIRVAELEAAVGGANGVGERLAEVRERLDNLERTVARLEEPANDAAEAFTLLTQLIRLLVHQS